MCLVPPVQDVPDGPPKDVTEQHNRLVALDHTFGERIHVATLRSPPLKALATVASLSVDEAIWFSVPLLAALVCLLAELEIVVLASLAPAVQSRRLAVDLFNDAVMVTGGGALIKHLARRTRPPYAKQNMWHITNGDQYSFPSGHSLFAAVMFGKYLGTSVALIGIPLVMWSRVAKGRHFPLDTICGAAVGALLAYVSVAGGTALWAALKLVVALAQLAEVLLATAVPRHQTPGYSLGSICLALAFALLPFGLTPPLGDSTSAFSFPLALLLVLCPICAPVGRSADLFLTTFRRMPTANAEG